MKSLGSLKEDELRARDQLTEIRTILKDAKNKIKSFYNKIDKTEAIKNGSETLTKELRKKKVSINLFEENLDKILQEFSYNSLDDLYIGIDNNQITPTQIINFLTGSNPTKEELVLKNIRNDKNISSKCDVSI